MLNQTQLESMALLEFGIVEEVDETNYLYKVLLPTHDDLLTPWLPLMADATQDDQSYGLFEKGTQVVLLLKGNGEDGVVLGAVYSEEDMPPVQTKAKWGRRFSDGTILEYDKAEHKLTVKAEGEISIEATGPIKVKGNQTVEIEGLSIKLKAQAITLESQAILLDAPLTTTNSLLVRGKLGFAPLP